MQSYILIKGPVGLIVRREGESTRSQGWASGVAGLGGRGVEAMRIQGRASGVAGLGGEGAEGPKEAVVGYKSKSSLVHSDST